jgi:naphthalene 1,2-dioxygenase system ferredoxin subunit
MDEKHTTTDGGWHVAVAVKDVYEGEPVACTIDGKEVAIYLVEGSYYATSNVCTHASAQLSDGLQEGCIIECPLHNARFDVITGKALTSPAEVDLDIFPIRVIDGHVYVRLSNG